MAEVVSERRREKRLRSLLGGCVVLPNGRSTMSCIVRDLGEHGARLKFGGAAFLAQEFDLAIDGRHDKRRARKVWTRDGDMGIEFA